MRTDAYLQFPLCALSFGQNINPRLNAILGFGLIHAGSKRICKFTEDQWQQFFSTIGKSVQIPRGFNAKSLKHVEALCGAQILGINIHVMPDIIEGDRQLREYLLDFQRLYGNDAWVRIKKDWFFNARDHHGLSYTEFSVLCAIYSVIGDKKLAIITRERIRRCALGYRSDAIMKAEFPRRKDGAEPLTERQLRNTVATLHQNRFFARATVSRRITYYSNRLDGQALNKNIRESRNYRTFFQSVHAVQDAELTASINQQRLQAGQAEPSRRPVLT